MPQSLPGLEDLLPIKQWYQRRVRGALEMEYRDAPSPETIFSLDQEDWRVSAFRLVVTHIQSVTGDPIDCHYYKEFLFAVCSALGPIVRVLEDPAHFKKILDLLPIVRYQVKERIVDKPLLLYLANHVLCLKGIVSFVADFKHYVENYGSGKKLMIRSVAKGMIKMFVESVQQLSEFINEEIPFVPAAELEKKWENGILHHVQNSEVACLILWVSDKFVEQDQIHHEDPNVALVTTCQDDVESYLERISFFEKPNFCDRLRIAMDCTSPQVVLNQINSGNP
eukprot:TRINITY_DN6633_c0_g1_i7.p1 TRINITY_DN6633_c0_g1~~TRINITY_DN6633_c0_g1_i7.p1  ORF type:complete len:281 (+),score=59.82 TRINITY_DN6633_c0_g1_i7:287-1129(+)